MVGLLQGGMAPQQQQPQQAPQQPMEQQGAPQQPQQPQGGGEGGDAQAMYNALVETMLGFLYNEGAEGTEQILMADDNPVSGIAIVTANLMLAAMGALEEQGKTVPPGVMAQAGMEVSEKVEEVAAAMDMVDETDALAVEMAYFIALDMLADEMPDNPPGAKAQYKELAQGLFQERMAMLTEEELDEETRAALMESGVDEGEAQGQPPQGQPAQPPMEEERY